MAIENAGRVLVWKISVHGYGDFEFVGTMKEAEETRAQSQLGARRRAKRVQARADRVGAETLRTIRSVFEMTVPKKIFDPGDHVTTGLARGTRQELVRNWVRRVFTAEEASDPEERSLRLAEEAVELVQACGVDAATVHRLVDYVFSRPKGEAAQEIAGCFVALYAAAVALDVDADEEFERELNRIQQPEVIERVRRRQHEKRAALVGKGRVVSGSKSGAPHGDDCGCAACRNFD